MRTSMPEERPLGDHLQAGLGHAQAVAVGGVVEIGHGQPGVDGPDHGHAALDAAEPRGLGVLPAARDIRCMGSAALNVCWVGCGRLDGFYQRNMQYWDFAAGELIAAEAGAAIVRPSPNNGQLLVASGPGIHAELVRAVA